MSGITPSSDRQAWVERLRQRMREQRDELFEAPPFPVYGLSAPALHPFALLEHHRDRRGWSDVLLGYGDPLSWALPAVSVRSVPRRGRRRVDLDGLLAAALAAEQRRAGGLTASDLTPEGPPTAADGVVFLDGVRRPVRLCRQGPWWAARVEPGSRVSVTVVGRGVLPQDVWLVVVDDLAPYWQGRDELAGRLADLPYPAKLPGPPRPWPAPTPGLDRHRALVDHALAAADRPHRRVGRASRVGRVSRAGRAAGDRRRGLPGRAHPRWRAAVRAHAALTGASRADAGQALAALLAQLLALAGCAAWFADPDLREAAVEETLRHAVFGEPVPSQRAQREWARWWDHGPPGSEPPAGWLAAWAVWADARS